MQTPLTQNSDDFNCLETALLSEAALAEDWLRPSEDEAWAYLQPSAPNRDEGASPA